MTHRCRVINGMMKQEVKITAPEPFAEMSDGKHLFEHYADDEGLLSWMPLLNLQKNTGKKDKNDNGEQRSRFLKYVLPRV